MLWQMPHVSVCDSHNSLPQSEHSLLAVLEQGNPSSSAEFLTSMISQPFDMEASLRFREPHTPAGAKNNSADSLKNIQVFFQEKWTLGHGDAVFSALLCKLLSVVGFPLHLCVGQDRIRSNGA